jgi:hypothetical protein
MKEFEEKYANKLAAAIEFLGDKWVLHPDYKFDPKHSHHEHIRQVVKIKL